MTDFISTALGLLPTPGALFEEATNRYVCANRPALELARSHGNPDDPDPEFALAMVGMNPLTLPKSPDTCGVEAGPLGWLFTTVLPGGPQTPRPALRLVTTHAECERQRALLDHRRVVNSLKINEMTERAIAHMQNSMLMLNDAMQGQRRMLDHINDATREFLAEKCEETSGNHLTVVPNPIESYATS